MKIGIYGGSFNPPHLAHKKIAEELIKKGYLDKVIMVPVGLAYEKDALIPFKHRYDMLKVMFKDERIKISDYENKYNRVFTFQTLDYFKQKYPNDEIYFICGGDNMLDMITWKNYQYILDNYKVLVVSRGNYNDLPLDFHGNVFYTNIKVPRISSSLIRKLFKEGNPVREYLDNEVLNYIKNHNLYKEEI